MNEKRRKLLMGKFIVIHILDEKTIQNNIHHTGWHLISFKNFYCYVLPKIKNHAEMHIYA